MWFEHRTQERALKLLPCLIFKESLSSLSLSATFCCNPAQARLWFELLWNSDLRICELLFSSMELIFKAAVFSLFWAFLRRPRRRRWSAAETDKNTLPFLLFILFLVVFFFVPRFAVLFFFLPCPCHVPCFIYISFISFCTVPPLLFFLLSQYFLLSSVSFVI